MNPSLRTQLALLFVTLNALAFTVNVLGISPKINTQLHQKTIELFLFTDSSNALGSGETQAASIVGNPDGIWPFETFYVETPLHPDNVAGRFRGLFAGFDLFEFLFYNGLILGVVLFLKKW